MSNLYKSGDLFFIAQTQKSLHVEIKKFDDEKQMSNIGRNIEYFGSNMQMWTSYKKNILQIITAFIFIKYIQPNKNKKYLYFE